MSEDLSLPNSELATINNSLNKLGHIIGTRISISGETGMRGAYELTLDEDEIGIINTLASVAASNPDSIISSIKAHPPEIGYFTDDGDVEIIKPKIETIPASQTELQTAALADDIQHKLDSLTSSALAALSSFLRAPKIHDGIDNHTKRQHYENGMSVMLNLIKTAAEKTPSQKIEPPLDQQFLNWWNNNKYTKNMRHKVSQAIQFIASSSTPESPLQRECQTFQVDFEKRGYKKQYIPESELENSIQFLTEHATDVITELQKQNQLQS